MKQPNLIRGALIGAVAGVLGSYAKALAEPPLQTLTEAWFPPTPAEKKMIGADPSGRLDHMPPAEMIQAAADAAHRPISKQDKLRDQQFIHYGVGAGTAAVYGALAEVYPGVTRGQGVPAGAVLYGLTHASAVPATGFQAWPWQLPVAAVLWEALSHLVFGLTVEVTRQALTALVERLDE
jgi:putative membrane protein